MNANTQTGFEDMEAIMQKLVAKKEQLRYLQSLKEMEGRLVEEPEDTVLAEISALEVEIAEDAQRFLEKRKHLQSAIENISAPQYQAVLYLRYFCGLGWEDIAKKMHYSPKHIQSLHAMAVKELQAGAKQPQ